MQVCLQIITFNLKLSEFTLKKHYFESNTKDFVASEVPERV